MMPSWSRDGKFIYFLSRRHAKSLEMWKNLAAGGRETLVNANADGEALESSDGRTIYDASSRGGIWQMPAAGIYFLASELPPWTIEFYNFQTQKVSPLLTTERGPIFYMPSLSIS
jgi:hypothetical protein